MQSLRKTVSSSPCTVYNLLLGAFLAQNGEQADAKDVKVPPSYGYEQGRGKSWHPSNANPDSLQTKNNAKVGVGVGDGWAEDQAFSNLFWHEINSHVFVLRLPYVKTSVESVFGSNKYMYIWHITSIIVRQAKITLGFNASTDLNEMTEETIHKHFMAKLQLVSLSLTRIGNA